MITKEKLKVSEVCTRYKPSYHASVPAGWANDPNGLIWYNGQAHLFFQHNPYSTEWGPMHWGHLTSTDLIQWREQPIAISPDKWYDDYNGCFSGTAIEKNGKLYLMYTGVTREHQQQCIAFSDDGVHFEKSALNPVIKTSDLPGGASGRDFRDPKVFRRDDAYYCIIGTSMNGQGNLLLYRSHDFEKWSYIGYLMEGSDLPDHQPVAGVYECPDIQNIDGQEILFASPQHLPKDGCRFQNTQSSVWMAGTLDHKTGHFTYDRFHELDSGFDFYAPQTMCLPDGRTVLIAWKEQWGRSYPTAVDNWVGSFTLPRQLTYQDGHLYQSPIQEIVNYRRGRIAAHDVEIPCDGKLAIDGVIGNRVELILTFSLRDSAQVGVKLFCGEATETLLYYDRITKKFVFDRSKSGLAITGQEDDTAVRVCEVTDTDRLSLHIFLDVSCVEVFIQNGYSVMTGNVYADTKRDVGIEFYSVGGSAVIDELVKYDIIVEDNDLT